MKATFVKEADGFAEHAELFRLERPAETRCGINFQFIVVSTLKCALDTGLPETYIFPTYSNGEVLDWRELEGSFQGAMDISKALRDGGYEEVR
jgi:hypothetical protein